jgi:beta-lactamase regulating signal transducer with metallopeptidase domain
MIALVETIGPMIWRASWQAALLALAVTILLRLLGERLSPQWRFALWGVVLVRLLVVATPASPVSAFNFVRFSPVTNEGPGMLRRSEATYSPLPHNSGSTTPSSETMAESSHVADAQATSPRSQSSAPSETLSVSPVSTTESTPPLERAFDAVLISRTLSACWLAGCLLLGAKLLATALVLRRRLSSCRPVTDTAVLDLLETCRRRMRLKRAPALFVTPECLSPCIVGCRNARIVLPESIVVESSTAQLRHVMAHELAHLTRRDVWTNWLLLAARTVHWFNPFAWWTVREMQAEREAACDELACVALGETDRSAYAATLIEIAASLVPSTIAPGLVGLYSSTARLKARVDRLLRHSATARLRTHVAAGLLTATALLGLTDAMPRVTAQAPTTGATAKQARGKQATKSKTEKPQKEAPQPKNHTVSGRCVEDLNGSALAGVSVRLYQVAGRTSPPVEIARTVSDDDGRYAFTGLVAPRHEGHLDRLVYVAFGFAANRPIGISFMHFRGQEEVVTIGMARQRSILAGKVIDPDGQPVAGATVLRNFVYDRPVAELGSATTDAEGRFELDDVPVYKLPDGKFWNTSFVVLHPDFPETRGETNTLPADVVVKLTDGCVVTGSVTDDVTGMPAAGAVITARRVDQWDESFAASDEDGRFRLVLPEGRYDFLADAPERVSIASTDRECLAGESIGLPELKLIGGGFISGRVFNTITRQTVPVTERGEPVMLGLYGPSQPAGGAISPMRRAAVDATGRFILRAAPGENFPYLVNTHGVRMAWDTRKQPPVIVKAGETTEYDMLITPEIAPEERLKAAQKLVAGLPEQPQQRTEQIIQEFRKLSRTVDETELWCLLMRELVAVGRDAVPQLAAELDRTRDNAALRRLAFALRAIGDPRAVPALIRAIPNALLPSSSDFGLLVGDKELTAFMQQHDLDQGQRAEYFDFGRPEREVMGALHALTKDEFDDAEWFGLSLSEDPRRQVMQRRIYRKHALRWQAWWEANWTKFTDDPSYQQVKLDLADEPLSPAPTPESLGKTSRTSGVWGQAVLSPASEQSPYSWHFCDLDTGNVPKLPAKIARDAAGDDSRQVADWAIENGVDLMCVPHRLPDGKETYVLRALGMEVREISPRDLRNLDRLIAEGTLPEGRPVGELLMHFDGASRHLVPDVNAAFLFVTREGSMGVIETTDRVTRRADVTGLASSPPGVGFHKGVRFNLTAIIP